VPSSLSLFALILFSRALSLSLARALSLIFPLSLSLCLCCVCVPARTHTHTHTQLHARTHRRSARMAPRLETLVVLEGFSQHKGRHQGRRQAQACLILIYFSKSYIVSVPHKDRIHYSKLIRNKILVSRASEAVSRPLYKCSFLNERSLYLCLKCLTCSIAALTPSHSEARPPAPVHSCLVRRTSQIFMATFLSLFLPQINQVKRNFYKK
jgi:hypothetical protein